MSWLNPYDDAIEGCEEGVAKPLLEFLCDFVFAIIGWISRVALVIAALLVFGGNESPGLKWCVAVGCLAYVVGALAFVRILWRGLRIKWNMGIEEDVPLSGWVKTILTSSACVAVVSGYIALIIIVKIFEGFGVRL